MDAKQYLSGVYLDNHIFSKNETIKLMEEYRNYKIKIMKTKAELLMKSLKRDMFTSEETKLLIEISQLEEKLSVYSLNFINLKAKLDGKVKEFKQLFALKENDWLDFYDNDIMQNKEEIKLNTKQIELTDLISNIRKACCSHLNVYDFANWEHYFQKLGRALTEKDVDSEFYTQIAITSDGATNYYKRYLSATDIVVMTECVKKINNLSSDSGKHSEVLKRQSILCNKGIRITFNIITNKSDHPIENDSQIYKNVDVTGIDIPELNDYDTWHYVGDRLPKDTFMCIVKMFNEFSDTWTTGTGVFDNGEWEATDSSGESFSVRYWRRCPDFEAEGHYVGLKEDIDLLIKK